MSYFIGKNAMVYWWRNDGDRKESGMKWIPDPPPRQFEGEERKALNYHLGAKVLAWSFALDKIPAWDIVSLLEAAARNPNFVDGFQNAVDVEALSPNVLKL